MTLNPTDPRPAYQQIEDNLRRAIDSGEIPPGERLPSLRELARQYAVTVVTVNRAIDKLTADGVVHSRHGKGYYVRAHRPVMRVSNYLTARPDGTRATWHDEIDQQGHASTQEIKEVATVSPPLDVVERLGLEADELTVVRRRIIRIDDVPVQLSDSYYPANLAQGTELARPQRLRGYTMAALERLGVKIDHFLDDIYLRMPTPAEANELQLGPGIPVLRLLRTTFAVDGRTVEVADQILAGDRYVLSYEVPAHPSDTT